MHKKVNRRITPLLIVSLVVLPCFSAPIYSAEGVPGIEFSAVDLHDQKPGYGVSLTEERLFTASFEPTQDIVEDADKEAKYAELLAEAENYVWSLSREEGYQDSTKFPYQHLGGNLEDWKTLKSDINESSENFFEVNAPVIVDRDGDKIPEVELTFTNKLLYGYNGIDGRSRKLVRNSILDYTGPYQLKVMNGDELLAQTEVQVRPYDSFYTASEIDKQLATLAAELTSQGIYAKVESIGQTVEGRDINAIFIAKSSQDLTDYQELSARAENDPTAVLEELRSGSLEYKVPVMYSNVHSDEIVANDGIIEFLIALTEGEVPYKTITGLTEAGQAQLEKEMAEDRTVWSELITDMVTGIGYIQGNGTYEPTDPKHKEAASVDMSEEEIALYYNIEEKVFDVDEILEDIFFILVPQENVDGRTYDTRTNANFFDLNRDNTFQTQPETRAMTHLIASWNPVSFHEIHGYYTQYQIEPCSPTHEPNSEYDLFIENAFAQGEAYGAASIANNDTINSFNIAMRDYLKRQDDGSVFWEEPFDDMSTSYTPQYAIMHGVNAYTVELPYGSADAVTATKYGFIGNAVHVAEHKDDFFSNQVENFERGVNNIDADTIDPWYVSQHDEVGKESDIFRPQYEENNNFFPEYYVIPLDAENQQDPQSASEMVEYLLRNDVKVKVLKSDFEVDGKTYKAGTAVVDMHQAKRNMANVALYKNLVISTWGDLYSEPLSNFSDLRGFDMDIDTTPGAFAEAELEEISEAPVVTTTVTGKGKVTILSNNSVHAVKAVNQLLAEGKAVAYISEGEHKGDFALSSKDFDAIKDSYILVAEKVKDVPVAQVITKLPTVYVPGSQDEFMVNKDGEPYGVSYYNDRLNYRLGWDRFAYGEQMGFNLTTNPEEADIIAGGLSLSEEEIELVKGGKPYIGYRQAGMESAQAAGLDIEFEGNDWYDALTTVEYVDQSMITDKYVAEEDYIVYGYGANSFTKYPETATVLFKTTSDDPIEGFIDFERIESYKDVVTAIDYKDDTLDMTIFANTMTNKAHQQDDYRFLSNAIYQRHLGEQLVVETPINTTAIAFVVVLVVLGGTGYFFVAKRKHQKS